MAQSSLKAIGARLMPDAVKHCWWYLTDAKWRKTYDAQQQRVTALRKAQRRAFAVIWTQTGGRVAAGPFSGMNYLAESDGCYPQKLLGTYEMELWPVIEEIVTGPYSTVVDIGAAEGYYVCGLARRMPIVRVKAFEAQTCCRARLLEMAKMNSFADRIEVYGLCRATDLQAALQDRGRKLVVCDVEGAEFDLLDPAAITNLANVDVLVEVHEHFRPGVREALERRFRNSHTIRVIPSVARTLADLPVGVSLDGELAGAAMEESRGVAMEWLWMLSQAN